MIYTCIGRMIFCLSFFLLFSLIIIYGDGRVTLRFDFVVGFLRAIAHHFRYGFIVSSGDKGHTGRWLILYAFCVSFGFSTIREESLPHCCNVGSRKIRIITHAANDRRLIDF